MEKKVLFIELNSKELVEIKGGNPEAEAIGQAFGHIWGSAIKMFLFCAAVQSGLVR